ncbi:ABC transporter ATP-binding protein [Boudabousia marimammalium]|uniref:ABC transporter ATP-binding protein n=1 Tax=Boudabousia marimammalium TaxID=156892 RepID=A0A1Q5PSZ3_9ACTO|nr:ABC transporter ATP-binding protein [Boudabousia marimammalium]
MLRAENISFAYGTRNILHNISIQLKAGEIVGLLGPNGTGKSTLVGVLSGDLTPATGTVTIAGKTLTDYDRMELAQTRSVMPQATEFPFAYLARDIVSMGRACWGRTQHGAEDERVVDQAMRCTDSYQFADRDVTRLSGGEKSRVTLARVIAQQASVVFLDEPTAALDIYHQEKTMRLCESLAAAGVAVVAVMHDIQLAGAYCDKIALMSGGAIAAYDTPQKVLTAEKLSAVYDHPIDVCTLASGEIVVLPRRSVRQPG